MNDQPEVWRPIPEWETYAVSSLGRVRRTVGGRTGGGTLAARAHPKTGYPRVTLSHGGRKRDFCTHVLVCTAFHGPRPPGGQVRHLDGRRTNCRADNLAWGTISENIEDKRLHGSLMVGDTHARSIISDDAYAALLADWDAYPKGRGAKAKFAAFAVEKYGATPNIAYDAMRNRARAQRIRADKGREYLGGVEC